MKGKIKERKKNILYKDKDYLILLVKGGFELHLWDGQMWEKEDEMSFESLLKYWLRDIQH